MWKCVPRRARELERGANHFDKRGPAPFANCTFNDEKNKRPGPPCEWFKGKGCWGSNSNRNNTNNNNKWNFHHLTSSWLNAITWVSTLFIRVLKLDKLFFIIKTHYDMFRIRKLFVYSILLSLYLFILCTYM
jgi:hypothetical protein